MSFKTAATNNYLSGTVSIASARYWAAGWFKVGSGSNDWCMGLQGGGGITALKVRAKGGDGNCYARHLNPNGENYFTVGKAYPGAGWVHYGVDVDPVGKTVQLFVNGDGTGTTTTYTNAVPGNALDTFKIFTADAAGSDQEWFIGWAAHIGLWEGAPPANAFSQLYNGGSGGNGKNPRTVGTVKYYWSGDALLGEVGGVTLSKNATTVDVADADNPNVDAYAATNYKARGGSYVGGMLALAGGMNG